MSEINMDKKLLLIGLVFLMCTGLVSAWEGLGSGTIGDPYEINNCTLLQNMSNDLTAYYELTGNIDCSATSTWNLNASVYQGFKPIGHNVSVDGTTGTIEEFTGQFDGNGYKISDLYINRSYNDSNGNYGNYVGLFAELRNASVMNVILENFNITGKNTIGLLAGEVYYSDITNVSVSGYILGGSSLGGISGTIRGLYTSVDYAYVENIESDVDIQTVRYECAGWCNPSYAGGVAGSAGGVEFNDIHTSGSITQYDTQIGSAPDRNGGIFGVQLQGDYYQTFINNSFSNMTIQGDTNVGGLVGIGTISSNAYLHIYNSYFDGVLEEAPYPSNTIANFGGILGRSYNTTMSNVHSSGNIIINNDTGSSFGGLVGNSYWANILTIDNSYSNMSILGAFVTGGLVGTGQININNSYFTGYLETTYDDYYTSHFGGLVGSTQENSIIENSYVAGVLNYTGSSSTTQNNCFIGYKSSGTLSVTNSYYDSDICSLNDTYSTPKTTSEMKTRSTFTGWDFDDIWKTTSSINEGYPFLWSLHSDYPIVDDSSLDATLYFTETPLPGHCNASDPEEDNLTYYYEWWNGTNLYLDGTYGSLNLTEGVKYLVNTLNSSHTSGDETWSFSCRAYDGEYYSDWLNSTSVNIIDPTLSYIDPTENGTIHNDRDWIYVAANTSDSTVSNARINLMDENYTILQTYNLANQTISNNFTGLSEGNYLYNITFNYSESLSRSLPLLSQKLDATLPEVTKLSPEYSDILYNVTNINFTYTISDKNLYAYNLTCYNDDTKYISFQNTSLTEESYNITEFIQFTTPGTYNCTMQAADDHTINEIDFKVKKTKKYLLWGEEQIKVNKDLKVSFNSEDKESITYKVEKDRIKPRIKLKDNGKKTTSFSYEIEYNGKTDKREEISNISGHYVILKDSLEDAYWVDSESNIEGQEVTSRVEGNKIIYDVTVDNEKLRNQNFIYETRSIGGLNIGELETNITINEGINFSIYGHNYINKTTIPTNLTISNGTYSLSAPSVLNHTVEIGCEPTTIRIDANDHMNTQEYTYEGCDDGDINASFWEAVLNIEVRNVISELYVPNATINITMGSYSNETQTDSNPIPFYLNNGTGTINISHPDYTGQTNTTTLDTGDNKTYVYYLIPEYSASVVREQTGEPFDFLELVNQSTCDNGTYTETVYDQQEDANSYSCTGNWSATYTCADTYDGLYDTYGQAQTGKNASVYINYTKPVEAINDSYWYLRKDFLSYERFNMSDYISCWDENKLKFRIDSNESASSTSYYCYNSTDWQNMGTFVNNGEVYEESMYWAYEQESTNYTSCNQYEDVEVTVKTFCPNKVIVNHLNSTDNTVTNIDCSYDYWYMIVNYQDASYSRTAIPELTDFDPTLYLLDLQKDVAVQIILIVRDLGDDYDGGKIKLYKYVNETRVVVLEQFLDIENRVVLWLDKDELYEVYMVDQYGQQNYLGDLIADQAGTKYLTLPEINILNQNDVPNDVMFSYTNIDRDDGTISLFYDDNSANGPNSITWRILMEETGQIVYENTTTDRNFVMTATDLNTYYTYYTDLTIDHNDYGEISEYRPIWYGSATVFEGWGDTETKYTDGVDAWANNTYYEKGDKVTYGDNVYRSVSDHTSTEEPNASSLFRDYPTDWEAGEYYQVGDLVTYPANTHNDYLVVSEHLASATSLPSDTPTIYQVLETRENETSDIVKLIIAILIPIMFALVFSQSTAEIGMTVSLIMMSLFQSFHWYSYLTNASILGETIITIIIGLFGVLTFWMWTRKARREE